MIPSIDLVILAGGRSSRMGEDKLMLRRKGRLLIEAWLEQIAWPIEALLVLPPGAVAPAELTVAVAHDAVADQGPLRGVLTAMQHARSEWQLIVPIDMPNLRRQHLDWISGRIAVDPSARLMMLRRANGGAHAIEPFPLLIHGSLRSTIEERLASGRRSLQRLADEPTARVIDAPGDWSASTWLNLNRPEDLASFLGSPMG